MDTTGRSGPRAWLIVLVAVAASLLSGCGASSPGAGNRPPTDPNDLHALFARRADQPSAVVYTATTSDGTGELTIARDGDGTWTMLTDNGFRIIDDGSSVTVCEGPDASDCHADESSTELYVLMYMVGLLAPVMKDPIGSTDAASPFAVAYTRTDDQVIAGRPARCAQIESAALTGTATTSATAPTWTITMCVDEELGVPLLAQLDTGEGQVDVRATDLTTSPERWLFEPGPAPGGTG